MDYTEDQVREFAKLTEEEWDKTPEEAKELFKECYEVVSEGE